MIYSNPTKPKRGAKIPVSQPVDSSQVLNNASGYVYSIDDWSRLERFLILGAEGGTYYVDQTQHIRDNAGVVHRCLQNDPFRTIEMIVDISRRGLAPKQDPGLYALALAASHGNAEVRQRAFEVLPNVARTASTFFHFLEELKGLRKLQGRSFRSAVRHWYEAKGPKGAAYQVVKYRERNGWTHRDALRLGHPKSQNFSDLFAYAVGKKTEGFSEELAIIEGFEAAKKAKSEAEVVRLIQRYGLTREMVPQEFLKSPEVWSALLPSMPLTAMMRNLGNMTASGLLTQGSEATKFVVQALSDETKLRHSRLHPIAILAAHATYSSGEGFRSSNAWNPVASIVTTLDRSFVKAFDFIEPTGASILCAVDVSPSMDTRCFGALTNRQIAMALAMGFARTEVHAVVGAFSSDIVEIPSAATASLTALEELTRKIRWQATDCSLPIEWAMRHGHDFDAFVTITDNETNYGNNPADSLRRYRRDHPKCRNVVLATTATRYSLADPQDSLSLDISGFSSAVPAIVQSFISNKPSEYSEDESLDG